ncbi:hypothetical protein [Nocardia sp. NPDC058666]|uniref:hypothetical protein n=1 Tax=Nocardia sp. NPDC058666 TaxID=3346587 RepID=UPI0036582AAD
MDLDRIRADVENLAAQFEVPAPEVEAGTTPRWCLDGVEPRFRPQQPPMLTIGPAFDTLSPTEQQGALAEAIVGLELQWAARYQVLFAALICLLVPYLLLEVGDRLNILPAIAAWQWGALVLVTCIIGICAASFVTTRKTIYRLDRRTSEVMSRQLTEVMIDLDHRTRTTARGPSGVVLRLSLPSKPRRLRHLHTDPA